MEYQRHYHSFWVMLTPFFARLYSPRASEGNVCLFSRYMLLLYAHQLVADCVFYKQQPLSHTSYHGIHCKDENNDYSCFEKWTWFNTSMLADWPFVLMQRRHYSLLSRLIIAVCCDPRVPLLLSWWGHIQQTSICILSHCCLLWTIHKLTHTRTHTPIIYPGSGQGLMLDGLVSERIVVNSVTHLLSSSGALNSAVYLIWHLI